MPGPHEIHLHLYIHHSEVTQELSAPAKVETTVVHTPVSSPKKDIFIPAIDMETKLARANWKRHFHYIFERGYLVWFKLEGSWADSQSGGSNDSGHLETADIANREQFREKAASAKGSHISKEKLVDEMVRDGLRLAREKGYEQADMDLYMETRAQSIGEGYGLKEENIAQLRSRVYQGRLELAS